MTFSLTEIDREQCGTHLAVVLLEDRESTQEVFSYYEVQVYAGGSRTSVGFEGNIADARFVFNLQCIACRNIQKHVIDKMECMANPTE